MWTQRTNRRMLLQIDKPLVSFRLEAWILLEVQVTSKMVATVDRALRHSHFLQSSHVQSV